MNETNYVTFVVKLMAVLQSTTPQPSMWHVNGIGEDGLLKDRVTEY